MPFCSLCTLEFQTRHESYMWLLNELDLYVPCHSYVLRCRKLCSGMKRFFPSRYKPHVWEFSRLNITHFVMSKRKLNLLCTSGSVHAPHHSRSHHSCSLICVHPPLHCRHRLRLG